MPRLKTGLVHDQASFPTTLLHSSPVKLFDQLGHNMKTMLWLSLLTSDSQVQCTYMHLPLDFSLRSAIARICSKMSEIQFDVTRFLLGFEFLHASTKNRFVAHNTDLRHQNGFFWSNLQCVSHIGRISHTKRRLFLRQKKVCFSG